MLRLHTFDPAGSRYRRLGGRNTRINGHEACYETRSEYTWTLTLLPRWPAIAGICAAALIGDNRLQ